MINAKQLRDYIVIPTLHFLGADDTPEKLHAAAELVMGTFAKESRLGEYLKQLGDGPALGIGQMEPETHADCWENWLAYKPSMSERIRSLLPHAYADWKIPAGRALIVSLEYATAMTRVRYLRAPGALPAAGDLAGQAWYWKRHYNTPKGAGTEAEYIASYRELVEGRA